MRIRVDLVTPHRRELIRHLSPAESTFSLAALEAKLVTYITDAGATKQPFAIEAIPRISKEQARQEAQRSRSEVANPLLPSTSAAGAALNGAAASSTPSPTQPDSQSLYADQLAQVQEFADYGDVLKSSAKPVELTESETEYVVSAVKHIFKEHIVFQVRNYMLRSRCRPPRLTR